MNTKSSIPSTNYERILANLDQFLKRHYLNEMAKGFLIVSTIALGGFLLAGYLESQLWLHPILRGFLFLGMVLCFGYCLLQYILFPGMRLFRIKRGLSKEQAAIAIGKHFPEVSDGLLNLLQLAELPEKSELLLASIDHKAQQLSPVPFVKAVDTSRIKKWASYILIPIVILLITWLSGYLPSVQEGYNRVQRFHQVYRQPAPFALTWDNPVSQTIQFKPVTIRVRAAGTALPEMVEIHYNNERYFMKEAEDGVFTHTVESPETDFNFRFISNQAESPLYTLEVIKTPIAESIDVLVTPPIYTGQKPFGIKNTGNATFPSGSEITWRMDTRETTEVNLVLEDSVFELERKEQHFTKSMRVYAPANYTLQLSNNDIRNYEELSFQFDVIADEYPTLKMTEIKDSLSGKLIGFGGQTSDDYGLRHLAMYLLEEGSEKEIALSIPLKNTSLFSFFQPFPDTLSLTEGKSYSIYFEATDNDAIAGGKKIRSETFTYYQLTALQQENSLVDEQEKSLETLEEQLSRSKENADMLKELKTGVKEKETMNFSDQRKLSDFLNRQQQEQQMMQRFTEELTEQLETPSDINEQDKTMNALLRERLEREQERLAKNEALLKEMEELAKNMKSDSIALKLEKMARNQKTNERSLEQLLELTKRYFLQSKAQLMSKNLEELAKQQERAADSSRVETETQEKLNDSFSELQKELDSLFKKNESLRKPLDIDRNKEEEQKVTEEQRKALDALKQHKELGNTSSESPKKNQKNAANSMKKIASGIQKGLQASGGQALQEDAAQLRQVLDNLLLFSFDQEAIMDKMSTSSESNPAIASYLQKQNELRGLFEHIDDSLFALSLRRPELSEDLNPHITDIYYNIDRVLESFAENQIYQGIAHQQYALTATNELGDFLSDILDNMQDQMGSGSGGGEDFQLPDLIMGQEELQKQMQQEMQKSDGQKNGEEPKNGEGDNAKETNGTSEKSGEGMSEAESQKLFELYKQQQLLRMALEEQLKNISAPDKLLQGKKISREMEMMERMLLEKGVTPETLRRMQSLQQQLLQLDNASFQKESNNQRESQTASANRMKRTQNQQAEGEEYLKELELLQRQVLPLRQFYQTKVQQYFRDND